jgi:hypothetical protein
VEGFEVEIDHKVLFPSPRGEGARRADEGSHKLECTLPSPRPSPRGEGEKKIGLNRYSKIL